MSGKPDLSTWLTKSEAASLLGVAEKTIERMVKRGKVQQAIRRRPGTASIAVFHPGDIETLKAEQEASEQPGAFVVPAGNSTALVATRSTPLDPMQLVEALRAQPFPIDRKRYLTLDEAVTYTGLGAGYIEQHCKGQAIGPRGRLVFKRADLEKL